MYVLMNLLLGNCIYSLSVLAEKRRCMEIYNDEYTSLNYKEIPRPSPSIPLINTGPNYKGGLKKGLSLSESLSHHDPNFTCQRHVAGQ